MTTLTANQKTTADTLRANLGFGDRRIAEVLGVSLHTVRADRERNGGPDREQIADSSEADGFEHLVIIPDTQWPYEHKPSEAALYQYIDETQPDHLVHIGDGVDFKSLSRFRTGNRPSQRIHLEEEIEYGRTKIAELTALTPDAKSRRYIMGNHDQRLARYLEDNAGELHDLAGDILNFARTEVGLFGP